MWQRAMEVDCVYGLGVGLAVEVGVGVGAGEGVSARVALSKKRSEDLYAFQCTREPNAGFSLRNKPAEIDRNR